MKFQTAVLSQPGGRQKNEDRCDYVDMGNYGCWVVADGLGGHFGGEIASKHVVEEVISSFKCSPSIDDKSIEIYLTKAQEKLQQIRNKEIKYSEMRTTIILLTTDYKCVRWAHVGDSRLYYFKGGQMIYQTKDHSVPQAMVNSGEITMDEIRFHEDRNRVLRAMGTEKEPRYEVHKEVYEVEAGDVFLLCTDGFWEYITETEMEVDLSKSRTSEEWIHRMENRLLTRAEEEHDNYTAMAVWVA